MPVVNATVLAEFVAQIFEAAGASKEGARLVGNSLVNSNLVGHDSHGIVRVTQYLDHIAHGELHPAAEPIIVHETSTVTIVDARRGFGQIAAHFAMNATIEKARTQGLAATALQHCNHVGRLGEWAQMAADQNLIGLAFCNGGRPGGIVAPFGGAQRLLGTNPIAAAAPVGGRPPFLIDFATSNVAEGKVRIARNKGQSIPEGWILDSQGRPSTRPEDLYNAGMLLPAAGHKGYGLSLLVEFMGGLLTGEGAPGMPNYDSMSNGVLFIVLSIEAFRPLESFLQDGAILCEQVKVAKPAPGVQEVLVPGEPEQRAAAQRGAEGISIDETTWSQLAEAGKRFGITVPA